MISAEIKLFEGKALLGRARRRFRVGSQIDIRVTVCSSPPQQYGHDGDHRPAKNGE